MRLRSTLLRWVVIPYFILFVVADQKNITAESGQDVTLTCRAPNKKKNDHDVTLTCGAPNNNIIVVEWSRTDLKEDYVLLYRDERFVPDNQHPSYKNRVDLQDRQMKDGDVSLILKNVTSADSGTYECRVFLRGANHRKRALLKTRPISIIHLSVVDPPGQPRGHTEDGGKEGGVGRSHHGGVIASVILLVVVAVVISKTQKKDSPLPPPPDEEAKETV
ncbi:unnamed protein product [Oreochromis niloticus]|nr:unnamed protein product [Mustela putorius furo]